MRCTELTLDAGEERPFGAPRSPFHVDADGDIMDADGWLVCCPARDVWHNDLQHAEAICQALNAAI